MTTYCMQWIISIQSHDIHHPPSPNSQINGVETVALPLGHSKVI